MYDPVSYAKLWRKVFKSTSSDWELEDNLSAVGDFLNDDGKDEVRIVYSRELPNHAAEMKYTYYNIKTGNQVKEKTFNVASP